MITGDMIILACELYTNERTSNSCFCITILSIYFRLLLQSCTQVLIHSCLFSLNIHRSGTSTQPIWSTYMYSTSSHRCYGTGNICPSSTVTSCIHSEDITVQCSKIKWLLFNEN